MHFNKIQLPHLILWISLPHLTLKKNIQKINNENSHKTQKILFLECFRLPLQAKKEYFRKCTDKKQARQCCEKHFAISYSQMQAFPIDHVKIRCANAKNDLHSFAVVCIIRVFTKLCSLLSIFFLPLYFSFSLFISLSHLPLAVSPLNFFLFHIGPKLHFAPFLFFHIPIAFVVFY